MESYYHIFTSGRGYWLPNGFGYTSHLIDAGVFSSSDLYKYNLDGCRLISVGA